MAGSSPLAHSSPRMNLQITPLRCYADLACSNVVMTAKRLRAGRSRLSRPKPGSAPGGMLVDPTSFRHCQIARSGMATSSSLLGTRSIHPAGFAVSAERSDEIQHMWPVSVRNTHVAPDFPISKEGSSPVFGHQAGLFV
jgi:hypothetical protein